MKVKKNDIKVVAAVAIPVAITTGYILQLQAKLKGSRRKADWYEEKLINVFKMLSTEQLQQIGDEIDMDIAFFMMTKSTLKDTM